MTRRCPHVGTIVIGGRPVGEVRCGLDAGHDGERWGPDWEGHYLNAEGYAEWNRTGGSSLPYIETTPHRASFEWEDELPIVFDTPEASIEVEVPLTDVDGNR